MSASKSDYEILGLPEGAERDLVEKKYGALLRSYKQRTDEKGATNEDLEYYKSITAAYDNIVGTVHDFSDPNPTSPIPFKVRNFFYKLSANLDHYKFFLVAFLMIGIIVLIVCYQIKGNKDDDIYLKFTGAFYTNNEIMLKDQLVEKSDKVKSPSISFFTVTSQTGLYDQEAQNQAVSFRAQFLSGAIDLIFIDKANYDVYVSQYAFLDLTDYINSNELPELETYVYENTGEGDNVPTGIYGIEFTEQGSAFFSDMTLTWLNDTIEGDERSMILCVCRMSKNKNKALKYMSEIIEKAYAAEPWNG